MKILAIYFGSENGTNPVYDRVLANIAARQGIEMDLLRNFPVRESNKIDNIRNYYHLPFTKKMGSWYRKCVRWFGTTPISDRWSKQAAEIVAQDYDVVLALCANSQLTPAVCGKVIAQKVGCKFAIYGVDAIPAPGGWIRKKNDYNGRLRIVRRNWSAADYVASANKYMLEFQLSTFKHKPNLQTSVVYTTSPEEWHINPPSKRPLFLYTGNLYGLRTPDHLFGAFKRILAERPDAELMLVGMKFKLRHFASILTPEEQKHVTIAPYTDNLAPLFAEAQVLLDIDADRQKDPFLSSKIASYLRVNRVIVCETGKDTPSRELFAGYRTIIQCDHSAESMYEGMKRALAMAETEIDFSERQPLIDLFSVEHNCDTLCTDLEKLLS
ncbi:MAG: hypothetical protein IIV29_01540 [Tidjanibacter sp.]|nr:hypothetical protein [Tidjanibacter sp.]